MEILKNQIKLLKKYGVSNYTIEGDKITINGFLDLSSLTSVDKLIIKNNVKKLSVGYNKSKGYCFKVAIDEIKAKDLLPLLTKTNAYGLQKFKSLLTF